MPKHLRCLATRLVSGLFVIVGLSCLNSCRRVEPSLPPPLAARVNTVEDLGRFRTQPVGAALEGHPWIAQITAVDLDRDGLPDVLVCDAQKNQITWIRQTSLGQFEEIPLATDIPSPVHVAAVEMNANGHFDLLVASMGEIFPNNDRIGSVIILENDGHQHFTKHVIADHIKRVTDVEAGDFNGDGKLDLAVAEFGYDQGEVCWMENLGNWQFKPHTLLNLSGTINVCVGDITGRHHADIVAVVSQQWEEIHLFSNDGTGNFTDKVLFGSTNEDFASSGISLCDLNRDGRPDILYTNGDGFGPSAQPGPRPWHGVQWLENLGDGLFKFHRIGDLPGAYSAVGVDLDGDGATDVVALSGFNDWKKPDAVSVMWFRNDGHQNFSPHVLAYKPRQLITLAAADFDQSGHPALVTGGFYAFPPYDEEMSRIMLWHPVVKP